ncbi:hypothetical protein GCM10011340_30980 [Roseivirga thermotolerans]|uniref:Uncharacterized protein n=1 Tax=Roseivirga thermotolerans TaxID=1758176 RepID=A0ABQ3IAS0_9BACT|nr:hypothetical protein GCM10011340_30980 [Roseivirga thermotolerans]
MSVLGGAVWLLAPVTKSISTSVPISFFIYIVVKVGSEINEIWFELKRAESQTFTATSSLFIYG